MFEKLEIVRMAQALAAHAGARQGLVARNIAHADTPGYVAQDLPAFASLMGGEDAMRATRAGHQGGAAAALAELKPQISRNAMSPDGNGVSIETEMVRAAEIRQQHDLALSIYRSASAIIRTSLGRG